MAALRGEMVGLADSTSRAPDPFAACAQDLQQGSKPHDRVVHTRAHEGFNDLASLKTSFGTNSRSWALAVGWGEPFLQSPACGALRPSCHGLVRTNVGISRR